VSKHYALHATGTQPQPGIAGAGINAAQCRAGADSTTVAPCLKRSLGLKAPPFVPLDGLLGFRWGPKRVKFLPPPAGGQKRAYFRLRGAKTASVPKRHPPYAKSELGIRKGRGASPSYGITQVD
jgi:hypothetical protein